MTMMLFRASRRGIPSQFSRWLSAQAQPQPNIPVQHTGIFINNEWRTSSIKKTFPVINPSTGKTVVEVQQAGQNDVEAAVFAAENAFKVDSPWRQMDASARGLLLNRLADLMERDADILASLESLDNGKPFADSSQVDIPSSIKVIRYFAGWTDKMHGLTIPIDGPYVCYTRREPVGVCAQIIPWNFPLLMMSWKIGPALSMGNVVILKPAEQTPLTALYTANLIKEAGFPPGVLNVLPGFGDTGAALTVHNRINKVAFTGSTEVGKLIQEGAAKSNLKRVTLELGGKSPNVIFPDVNVDFAVQQAHLGIFFNMGQVCCAGSRTFVHSKIYDEFVEKSAKLAQNRRVGNPFEANTEQGPQIDQDQVGKIEELVESGKKEGAQLVAGGCALKDREGYFFQPTVFANVKDDMRIAKEEIFGPVQQLLKFEDDDKIIARANNTTYGLASAVYTNDLKRASNFIEKVQAGTVWVNCYNVFGAQAPFGGFKMSGQGRELGSAGLEQYTELKTVIINAK